MSVAALRSILESRWHGPAVHGHAQALAGVATGIADLDRALGAVGIPIGRLTEVFGERSCGKSTLAYALLARCTHRGDIGALIDPERCFFAPAAESAGIILERLIVVRPRDAAACRRAADAIVRSGACAVVVLDGASSEALQTHHCARLVAQAEKTATILIALSHGTSQPLASFASLRIRARGLAPLWQSGAWSSGPNDDRLAGYRIAFDIAKSKMSTPGKVATFDVALADVADSWPMPHVRCDEEESAHVCVV